jgi:hypothetical protein
VGPRDPEAAHGGRGARLSLTASGYGVQTPAEAPALAQVAGRAGGELQLTGEAGWQLRLDVKFSHCGRRG